MRIIQPRKPSVHHSEQGMIAIMTTMVLMIVISLIVLGFAQISRRNQRQSLDRQLSTQAFYAAESGINQSRQIIQDAVDGGQPIRDKADCGGSGTAGFYSTLTPVIDAGKNVKFTCLLVDPTPKSIQISDVGTTSVVFPVASAEGTPITRIKLDWQSKVDTTTPLAGCPGGVGAFSAVTSWACGYGVLRFDLVPTGGVLNANSLRTSTMTMFAVPVTAGGNTSTTYMPDTANTEVRKGIACTNTGCTLNIQGGLGGTSYYMRITSLYRNVALQVTPFDASGNQLKTQGAQAVIDSTGKAGDVLRRIQVRVPLSTTSRNQLSDYAIEMSASLCKRFAVMSGYISSSAGGVSSNPLCTTFTSP